MKRLEVLVFAGALLIPTAGILAAQRSTTAPTIQPMKSAQTQKGGMGLKAQTPPPEPVMAPLGVGTAFNATLDDALDTRKVKAGDPVSVEISEDVTYERSLIFPKGTKVTGHVIRATSGGRGRAGSALFIQLEQALLKDGEEVLLNAGIQALAAGPSNPAPGDTDLKDAATPTPRSVLPVEEGVTPQENASADKVTVLTATYDRSSTLRPPVLGAPNAEGELTADGLFTPESRGAWGRPDLKVYTPTSEGSRGTVLLSSKKNLHIEAGTRLLLVVQPPPGDGADADAVPNLDLDQ